MLTCIGGPRDTLTLYSVQRTRPGTCGSRCRSARTSALSHGWTRGSHGSTRRRGCRRYFKGYDREGTTRESYLDVRAHGQRCDAHAARRSVPVRLVARTSSRPTTRWPRTGGAARGTRRARPFSARYRTYGHRWLNKHPTRMTSSTRSIARGRGPVVVLADVVVRDVDARPGHRLGAVRARGDSRS